MQPIEQIIEGYTVKFLAKKIGVNYNTLLAQLNPNNPRPLTLENELKIRQALTK